jgi:hypothetical protein
MNLGRKVLAAYSTRAMEEPAPEEVGVHTRAWENRLT